MAVLETVKSSAVIDLPPQGVSTPALLLRSALRHNFPEIRFEIEGSKIHIFEAIDDMTLQRLKEFIQVFATANSGGRLPEHIQIRKFDPRILGEEFFAALRPEQNASRRQRGNVNFVSLHRGTDIHALSPALFMQRRRDASKSDHDVGLDPRQQEVIVDLIRQMIGDILSERNLRIGVNFIRTLASASAEGKPVGQGAHQDECDLVVIAARARENIAGGITELIKIPQKEKNLVNGRKVFEAPLSPGMALQFSDHHFWHDTTPIRVVAETREGFRDVFILQVDVKSRLRTWIENCLRTIHAPMFEEILAFPVVNKRLLHILQERIGLRNH